MTYLTYDEFKELTGNVEVQEEAFKKLLPKASDLLDNATDNFYQFNNLENDVEFRKSRFKKALCAQVTYFEELGAMTFEGINKAPQSFSAGRTSVSNTSRYSPGGANESKQLVAEEVYLYLEGTGLLYRGVGS